MFKLFPTASSTVSICRAVQLFHVCSTSLKDMEPDKLLKIIFVPRVLRVLCLPVRVWRARQHALYTRAREKDVEP